jgi:hypothetical protein
MVWRLEDKSARVAFAIAPAPASLIDRMLTLRTESPRASAASSSRHDS